MKTSLKNSTDAALKNRSEKSQGKRPGKTALRTKRQKEFQRLALREPPLSQDDVVRDAEAEQPVFKLRDH